MFSQRHCLIYPESTLYIATARGFTETDLDVCYVIIRSTKTELNGNIYDIHIYIHVHNALNV